MKSHEESIMRQLYKKEHHHTSQPTAVKVTGQEASKAPCWPAAPRALCQDNQSSANLLNIRSNSSRVKECSGLGQRARPEKSQGLQGALSIQHVHQSR